MKYIVIKVINFYKVVLSFDGGLLSFLAPNGACRYSPTCSVYAKQQIEKYGLIKGLYLGGKRILSCH